MKTVQRWAWLWLVGLVAGGVVAWAQALPQRAGYITDEAGVLSLEALADNEALLAEHAQQTGQALYVLIVDNLGGLSATDYDKQLTASWGLGEEHVLLLISLEEQVVHLSTGTASKATYPDERLNAVVEAIVPYLVLKNFDQAISAATDRLVNQVQERVRKKETKSGLEAPLRLALIAGVAVLSAALFFLFRA